MESTEATMNTVVMTHVVEVKEHFWQQHVSGIGKDAVFASISKGWFLHLHGSYEALYMGVIKPNFKPGDRVKITFEKVP